MLRRVAESVRVESASVGARGEGWVRSLPARQYVSRRSRRQISDPCHVVFQCQWAVMTTPNMRTFLLCALLSCCFQGTHQVYRNNKHNNEFKIDKKLFLSRPRDFELNCNRAVWYVIYLITISHICEVNVVVFYALHSNSNLRSLTI